jgi:hypothetical protein
MMHHTVLTLAVAVLVTVAQPVRSDTRPGMRSLRSGDMAQISAAHRGRPLIIHAWGVTCAPCLVELPRWAALLRSVGRAQVVFIEVESAPRQRIERLIGRAGLQQGEHWVMADDENVEQLRDEIDPGWQGELPHTVLIDAQGRIAARTETMDPKVFRAWLAGKQSADPAGSHKTTTPDQEHRH